MLKIQVKARGYKTGFWAGLRFELKSEGVGQQYLSDW